MKHEESTLKTKKALALSLRHFMEKKPLSKITVSEIIADCGVNRKTFYYHFENIYALLKWMLEDEAIEVVKKFDLMTNFPEAVLFVLDYVRTNKHLLCCAYDSIGRDEMKRFFYADFIGIMKKVIEDTENRLHLHIKADFLEFLSHLYTEALAGLLIDEFTGKTSHDPETAVKYLTLVLQNSLPGVLKSAAEEF